MKKLALALFGVVVIGSSACGDDDAAPGDAAVAADTAASSDTAATTDTATATDAATTTDAAGADAAGGSDAAAGDGPVSDGGAPDTATPTDGGTFACTGIADAGATCNTVVNGASNVMLVVVATPIPTGTGGPIADGRYYLTEFKGYAGTALPAGQTLRQTLELCGNTGRFASDESSASNIHKNFTISPTGTAPNIAQVCSTQMPDVNISYASYTATPTALTLYSTQFSFSVTFTKQ